MPCVEDLTLLLMFFFFSSFSFLFSKGRALLEEGIIMKMRDHFVSKLRVRNTVMKIPVITVLKRSTDRLIVSIVFCCFTFLFFPTN